MRRASDSKMIYESIIKSEIPNHKGDEFLIYTEKSESENDLLWITIAKTLPSAITTNKIDQNQFLLVLGGVVSLFTIFEN